MNKQFVVHNTFVIERSFPQPPERIFSAFADAAKKRRWFAEGESHDVKEFEMDFRVGGTERAQYRFKEGTPFSGVSLTNEGSYLDIVPNRRVVTASTMTFGENCISASLVTVEFLRTDRGPTSSAHIRERSLRAPMVLKSAKRDGVTYSNNWQRS